MEADEWNDNYIPRDAACCNACHIADIHQTKCRMHPQGCINCMKWEKAKKAYRETAFHTNLAKRKSRTQK